MFCLFFNMGLVRFVFALHEAGGERAEPAGVLVVLARSGAPSGRGSLGTGLQTWGLR